MIRIPLSRSPGRFIRRRVGASGSCSGGRGNVLAVINCCYVAFCSTARGSSTPTGEERGGAYRGGHPPTACLIRNSSNRRAQTSAKAADYRSYRWYYCAEMILKIIKIPVSRSWFGSAPHHWSVIVDSEKNDTYTILRSQCPFIGCVLVNLTSKILLCKLQHMRCTNTCDIYTVLNFRKPRIPLWWYWKYHTMMTMMIMMMIAMIFLPITSK